MESNLVSTQRKELWPRLVRVCNITLIVEELNFQLTTLGALATLGAVASSHQPVCASAVTG